MLKQLNWPPMPKGDGEAIVTLKAERYACTERHELFLLTANKFVESFRERIIASAQVSEFNSKGPLQVFQPA